MRKIEQLMCYAIRDGKDWKLDNTRVEQDPDSSSSYVYLHDNHIATVTDNDVTIYDGGWQSVTTKSRLNAIINEFCNSRTDGVYQRQHVWYLKDNNVERKFVNGYTFAWSIMTPKIKLNAVTFTIHDKPMKHLLWCDKLGKGKRNKPAKINGIQHSEVSDAVEHTYYVPVQ